MDNARVLLVGFYGRRNFGDDLMVKALSDFLIHHGAYTTISAGPNYPWAHLGASRGVIISRSIWRLIKELRYTDIVIQGGGTIFHDQFTPLRRMMYWRNLLVWCGLFALGRLHRCRVLMIGAGIGPVTHPISKGLCRLALSLCHAIGVRDRESLVTARSLVGAKAVIEGFDLSLLMSDSFGGGNRMLRETSFLRIVVMPCSLQPFTQDRHHAMEFWRSLATALSALSKHREIQITTIALFSGNSVGSDEESCAEIEGRLGQKGERLVYPADIDQIMDAIRSCDLVVSARYHGLVSAYLAGKRMIGIAYNRKVKDFLTEIGVDSRYCLEISKPISPEAWGALLMARILDGGRWNLDREEARSRAVRAVGEVWSRAVAVGS